MAQRTVTFDDEQWQLVPRKATHDMLLALKPRAGDIAKVVRKDDGKSLEFSIEFPLIYRIMLAAAPANT